MSPETLIALALVLPLAGGLSLRALDRSPNAREAVSLLTGGALFGVVLQLLPLVRAGERPTLRVLEMVDGLNISFTVEPLGMLFALVASGLWIVTTAYAIGYMRGHHERNQTRFYTFFAVAISAAVGVAFAGNLLTLFVFYEVLTLSTYPLVTHHQTEQARRAGRIYLGILLSTSICFLLLAILWTWQIAGRLDFVPGGILQGRAPPWQIGLLLGLFAFGIGKAALMPFHRWLPNAMVAPTPVSALLHAVAVVKAGVFSVLKVAVYVFGIDLLTDTGTSIWLMYAASFTLIAASIGALYKDNLKARLAYSTISQLAYIVLGAALATPSAILGAGMHIAMHALGKITLFFCAGAILVAAHKTEVSELNGLGRKMPLTMAAFFVGSLSIIGLPPAGGSWSKWFLAMGALEADQVLFVAVLMASSLLSIGYLMPIVARAFFLPGDDPEEGDYDPTHHDRAHGDDPAGAAHAGDPEPAPVRAPSDPESPNVWEGMGPWRGKIREAPLFALIPIWITAIGCIMMFVYAEEVYELLLPLVMR
jgi:multicomponent Na+:H+ antiporter subunit D